MPNNIVLNYKRVSSRFGRRGFVTFGASRNHKGTDFAAPKGTPVRAMADGFITKVERQRGYGNVVYIKHDDGTETRYAHLSKFAQINVGQRIHAAEPIGAVGSTGISTGAHLHFEVRDANGIPMDPEKVLNGQIPTNYDLLPKKPWDVNHMYANSYNTSNAEDKAIAAAEYENKREDSITFSYQAQLNDHSSGNIIKNFLGTLFNKIVNIFDSSPKELTPVDLNLSKENLMANGFSVNEIDGIAQLKAQKETSSLTETLGNVSTNITSDDLRAIGIEENKIEMLNSLAQQKQNIA